MKKNLINIINYACEDEVFKFCENISKCKDKDSIFIAIINNKKSEGVDLSSLLQTLTIDYKIYNPDVNLGYLNGCFYGVKMFLSNFGYLPKWCFISNTDIIIENYNFFEQFYNFDYGKEVWCVCPSVTSLDKRKYSNPHYKNRLTINKINRIIKVFNSPISSLFYSKLSKISNFFNKNIKEETQLVYSAHGSFFALNNEFFLNPQNYDFNNLLYGEELYIAEICLKNQKNVFYRSDIEIIHNENSITGKLNRMKRNRMISNAIQYIKSEFY